MFQESIEKERFINVVIPGSEVPNWFRHQSVGDSINLEVPSYLFKQIRGIVVCAIFGPHQHRPPYHLIGISLCADSFSCCFSVDGVYSISHRPLVSLSKEFDTVESDHRWFMYLLLNCFEHLVIGSKIGDGSSCQLEIVCQPWVYEKEMMGSDMMGSDMMDIENTIRIRETIEIKTIKIEIKKCGAHVVYEEEIEDLKQSMGQSERSSSIIPYNEGADHFEEDIKSKRSRDDENGACSTHIPHPKTKRVRPSDGE